MRQLESDAPNIYVQPVLVSGAAGFIGQAVIRQLVQEGREVYGLIRSTEQRGTVEHMGAVPVVSDLEKPTRSLHHSLEKCDLVIHLAGRNEFGSGHSELLFRDNVVATENLLNCSANAGVKKILLGSSAITIGEAKGETATESTRRSRGYLSDYEKTKSVAEKRAFEIAGRRGLDLICLKPASVQGPGRIGGTAKIMLNYLNGKPQTLPDSTISLIDIDDCVNGFMKAERYGTPGESYILSGATVSIKNILEKVEAITGVNNPDTRFIGKLLIPAAILSEAKARLTKSKPALTLDFARTALHGARYDGQKATTELGLIYTPLEETLVKTIDWYVKYGYVRASQTIEFKH